MGFECICYDLHGFSPDPTCPVHSPKARVRLDAKTRGLILDIAIASTQSVGDDAIDLALEIQGFIEDKLDGRSG